MANEKSFAEFFSKNSGAGRGRESFSAKQVEIPSEYAFYLPKKTPDPLTRSMPRRRRFSTGGYVFHVLNRAVGRSTLFEHERDYAAFERVLEEARQQVPMRLLAYCLMPNHWHLALWPIGDDDLSKYMHWLTVTHTQRWHKAHGTSGTGPLYQGRFKSFPVEEDDHFFTVCRYVERNPQRANLVSRAELWRWSSLWHWWNDSVSVSLNAWPLHRSSGWVEFVNTPQTEAEIASLRRSVRRGTPFGSDNWQREAAKQLGLESTLRGRGRPRRKPKMER